VLLIMFEVKKCPRQNPVQMVIPPAQGFRDYGIIISCGIGFPGLSPVVASTGVHDIFLCFSG
ncbi:MAG: hypothetical protein ACLU7V_07135, partial [Anaerovoracaceae bacterium]